MSNDVLELFTKEYLELFDGYVEFIWHGGEPMLPSIDFYHNAIRIQKLYSTDKHRIRNLIQTNGTLITDEWAEFFKTNDFGVGISLDGTAKCHNKFRKNNSGVGSFEKIINAIEILRRHGVEPGILQTVPKSSVKDTKENLSLFVEGLHLLEIGINVFNDIEKTNPIMQDETLSNDDYFDLFKSNFDFWLERNDSNFIIREIDSLVFGVLGKQSSSCTNSGTCTSFMTVNWDGTVTPSCERLLKQSSYIGKNIKDTHLIDILNSNKRLEFAAKVNTLPECCKKCEWLYACHNGCTYHRTGGVSGKYFYCDGQKRVFSYYKKKLEEMKIIAKD